ncbi:sugar phosphate isomerase/epimerase [Cerasibacillus terrae]|uniref:Sugar phosphate isomerase/epimerase n=1 Tax=Cerasibacillus terrae TaxID=2498845 RepID=A0A5C8NGR3_9BACI|nr:sugar phosphate isomerase/epimerase family protein [Cerasibacillus terrae]TXL61084.1 sugar phosphate isomerase/epimerase [Cerasibacillus terrae]
MLKGINQWCYPKGTPLEKVFEYSRDAGFDAVELNLNATGDVGITVDTTINEAKEIVKLASSYQLELRSLSTGLLWDFPLSDASESIRMQGRNIIKKQIEIARVMGLDTILVVPGTVNESTCYADCYNRSQEELKKLIPFAEEYQVNMGIENVWNKFLLSPLEMATYIDELDSDYVGAYFDVGNVLQFGYPEQWIRTLGKRIKKIHVKDFRMSVGNITGFVPLFAGDVNWEEVYKALTAIGYDDTLTAELTPYKIAPNLLAEDTARQIDRIIKTDICTWIRNIR